MHYLKLKQPPIATFEDNSFDHVIAINTIHNEDDCKILKRDYKSFKKNSFITVDAYKMRCWQKLMYAWNLTAKTIMSVNEWKVL